MSTLLSWMIQVALVAAVGFVGTKVVLYEIAYWRERSQRNGYYKNMRVTRWRS